MSEVQREPSYEFRNLALGLHEYYVSLTQAGFSTDEAISLTHMFSMSQILLEEIDDEGEDGGDDPLGPWRKDWT